MNVFVIMGIPAYFSFILKNHATVLKAHNNQYIDHLLLDANSIIYDCIFEKDIYDDAYEVELIDKVCIQIEEYITLIKPKYSVYIAFDGVAPVAKLQQQRERRYKAWYTKQLASSNGWNSANITPGTQFMNKLSSSIHKYFADPTKYDLCDLHISTSTEAGEGEHKLCKYIRNSAHMKNATIVLYGLDADLIMLSLLHLSYCKNIYLFRETPEFAKQINASINPDINYLLHIKEFSKLILHKLNNKTSYKPERIYDYVFISFLLGNDFLPHFPALNLRTTGMDHLLEAYSHTIKNTSKSLIYKNKIQWSMFRTFMLYLVKKETTIIQTEFTKRSQRKMRQQSTIEKRLDFLPLTERSVEKQINPLAEGWQNRYYHLLFDIYEVAPRMSTLCTNYLEGLEWTFKYYTGDCPDWEWSYKYNYPPLLQDLYKYIPYKDHTYMGEPHLPLSPIVQLAYVLPKEYIYLLPAKHHNAILNMHKEHESREIIFTWAFCKYFWESHVTLSPIILKELVKMLNI